jgi:hypothetical protein
MNSWVNSPFSDGSRNRKAEGSWINDTLYPRFVDLSITITASGTTVPVFEFFASVIFLKI